MWMTSRTQCRLSGRLQASRSTNFAGTSETRGQMRSQRSSTVLQAEASFQWRRCVSGAMSTRSTSTPSLTSFIGPLLSSPSDGTIHFRWQLQVGRGLFCAGQIVSEIACETVTPYFLLESSEAPAVFFWARTMPCSSPIADAPFL